MKIKISVNFTKGFSRALDLSGTKQWPNLSNGRIADYEALRSDWENVGQTIKKESGRYKTFKIN